MSSTSWEHQDEVREALSAIVNDPVLGKAALSSPQTMSNLLKDYLPGAPRERGVLVAAAEAGLAQSLEDRVSQGMDVATASSLTALDLAGQAPFTQDACRWVVGELVNALGLDAATAGGGQPDGAGISTGTEAGTDTGNDDVTLPPADHSKLSADKAETEFADGQGTSGTTTGGGDSADGSTPGPGGKDGGSGGSSRTGGKGRLRPRWLVLGGLAIVVVVLADVLWPKPPPHPSISSVEPLSKIISSDVGDCEHIKPGSLHGVTASTSCTTSAAGLFLTGYQFDSPADYQAGLNQLRSLTGWDPSVAGSTCPPSAGSSACASIWHSNVNKKYKASGQVLDIYSDSHSGDPAILWAMPTQRVVLFAVDTTSGATFGTMWGWWKNLTYA